MAQYDADGKKILMGDKLALLGPDGEICTRPLVGGSKYPNQPASPIYFESAHLRTLTVEHPWSKSTLLFHRIAKPALPDNIADIEAAVEANSPVPMPVFGDSHSWVTIVARPGLTFDPGITDVPMSIILNAKRGMWLRVTPNGGDETELKITPTIAAG